MLDAKDIKSRVDCRDLARQLLGEPEKTTRAYSYYFSPFRDDGTTPSLTVYSNQFKDHGGSGESWDCFAFVQKYLDIDFYEALRYLAGNTHIERDPVSVNNTRLLEPPSKEWQLAIGNFVNEAHIRLMQFPKIIEYLQKERGLSLETIKHYKLGFNPDWIDTGYRDDNGPVKAAPGIVIPWQYEGMLWAVRIRVPIGSLAEYAEKRFDYLEDKYISIRGSKQSLGLFGESFHQGDTVLIVEGEFDCMLGQQYFDDWKIITRGSAGDHARISPEWRDKLKETEIIYSLLDNDKAGQLATVALDTHFTNHNPLSLPAGDDLTEYFIEHRCDVSEILKQSRLWWSHEMPNAWRSAISRYMPPTAAPMIEAFHESARRGYLNPECFCMEDLLQSMKWLDYDLSDSSIKRVFKQISEVFFSFLVPLNPKVIKATQNEINSSRGRKPQYFEVKSLPEIRNTMLKWARPRIVEKYLPAIEKSDQSAIMTTYEVAMLEAIDFSRAEAESLSSALNEALRDVRIQERKLYTRAMNKAKYTYDSLLFSLRDRETISLPEVPISSAKDYRAILLRAVIEDDLDQRRSNREQGEIIGVDPQNVHRYRKHAGVENVPQFDDYPVNDAAEIDRQGYEVKGFPRQIIIENETKGYHQDSASRIVSAAIEQGKEVSIRYQVSSKQRVVRDTPLPVPVQQAEPTRDHQLSLEDALEVENEVSQDEQIAPVEDVADTSKTKVITMKPGNYYGEGYDPNWIRAQLRLALSRSQKRYVLRDIRLIDTLTGEIIRQNVEPRDIIDVILGKEVEPEQVKIPSEYLDMIAN